MDFLKKIDDEFTRYFTNLGFIVSWDFDKRGSYYEIIDPFTNEILCQVDVGTPIAHFLEDLEQFVQNKDGTSSSDYICNFVSDDKMNEIYNRTIKNNHV